MVTSQSLMIDMANIIPFQEWSISSHSARIFSNPPHRACRALRQGSVSLRGQLRRGRLPFLIMLRIWLRSTPSKGLMSWRLNHQHRTEDKKRSQKRPATEDQKDHFMIIVMIIMILFERKSWVKTLVAKKTQPMHNWEFCPGLAPGWPPQPLFAQRVAVRAKPQQLRSDPKKTWS